MVGSKNTVRKILIIAPSYYPNSGGVEGHVRNVVKGLSAMGYAVVILTRHSPGIPRTQIVDGVKVYRLPRRDSIIPLGVWSLRHISVYSGVCAVHTHDYFPWALRRLFRKKSWVHTFHGYEGFPLRKDAILSRRRVREEIGYCVGVGKFIEKWYGTECDYYTYGAVDIKSFSVNTKKKIRWDYIFYGRLEEDTGFKAYLEAFKILKTSNPALSMVVVGGGSLRKWAEEYSAENSLGVDFMGVRSSVLKYLAASKVALVSGYLGIIEAGVMCKPIVSFYNTPIKKDYLLLHPMAENIFIAGTLKELVHRAEEAASNSTNHTKAMYNWSRDQTWEKIVKEYASHY